MISQAEVVSESPQIVDYTIAHGARWPSGAPLRPADLVRTWRERRADRVLGDLGYRDVASVRPTSAGTGVAVTFARPYADWESLFNLIVPAATATRLVHRAERGRRPLDRPLRGRLVDPHRGRAPGEPALDGRGARRTRRST